MVTAPVVVMVLRLALLDLGALQLWRGTPLLDRLAAAVVAGVRAVSATAVFGARLEMAVLVRSLQYYKTKNGWTRLVGGRYGLHG